MDKRRSIYRLLRDRRGATAVEYGLIACLIVVAMITALKGIATSASSLWGQVSNEVIAKPGV